MESQIREWAFLGTHSHHTLSPPLLSSPSQQCPVCGSPKGQLILPSWPGAGGSLFQAPGSVTIHWRPVATELTLNPAPGEVCPVWVCSQVGIEILLLTNLDTPVIRQQGHLCVQQTSGLSSQAETTLPFGSACLTCSSFFLGFCSI